MDQSSPCRAAVGTTSLGHRCFFSAVHVPRRIHIGIPALITCLEGFDGCRTGVSIATVAILQFSEWLKRRAHDGMECAWNYQHMAEKCTHCEA